MTSISCRWRTRAIRWITKNKTCCR